MKGTYKRELNTSYVILEEPAMNGAQYYQMKMVTENNPKHLLKVSVHTFNGEKQFYYDISGKQSISCLFEKREMNAEQLFGILSGLREVLGELENYFLDENYLCLNPEYMYINVSTNQLYLCFYPCEEEEFFAEIRNFAEYLLNCIDHQDEKAVKAGYQLYRFTRDENFSPVDMIGDIIKEQIFEKDIFSDTSEKKGNAYEEINDFADSQEKSYAEGGCEQGLEPEEWEETGENRQEMSKKQWKRICFILLIPVLSGAGYGVYQYALKSQTPSFTMAAFLSTRDIILAVGGIVVGAAGFLLLFLYSIILKKGETALEPAGDISTESAEEYSFEKDGSANEQETSYETTNSAYEQGANYRTTEFPYEQEECDETVLLRENIYIEEGILVEKLKKADKKNPQKIILNTFPFLIGKREDMVDYVLSDKSVSRIHAKLIKNPTENIVYLMDLNSKNGTLKNGIPLDVNETVPLVAGDEITFGKVTFTYH